MEACWTAPSDRVCEPAATRWDSSDTSWAVWWMWKRASFRESRIWRRALWIGRNSPRKSVLIRRSILPRAIWARVLSISLMYFFSSCLVSWIEATSIPISELSGSHWNWAERFPWEISPI